MPQLSLPLQPRGSRAGATARTRAKAARAPPRVDPTPLPEPCVAAQSLPGRGRCHPPHPVHPSRLPASLPARPRSPGCAPPSAPPSPARPCGGGQCARARARRRPGSPSERPRPACAVRAGGLRLFEQEGGHISPSRPPSPHPPPPEHSPRDSPFPQPGPQRLSEASPSRSRQDPAPCPRCPLASPSSPEPPKGSDLALPRRTPRQQPQERRDKMGE